MKDYFGSENWGFSLTTDIVITEKTFYDFNHESTLTFCLLGKDYIWVEVIIPDFVRACVTLVSLVESIM